MESPLCAAPCLHPRPLPTPVTHARYPRPLSRNSMSVRQCTRQRRHVRQERTDLPHASDGARLDALGPEEVEEGGGAEDCGHGDADEDVE
jgi:hypothetical protein